ncbi:hypothetical protein BH18ACI2_BH18ACI2_20850 [soil metagenome]
MVVSLPYVMLFLPPWKGKLIESWESSGTPFKVRVNMHAEANGGFVPGAYYVFQSAPSDSGQWREVMTFRHDDPVAIPREQVGFVNDRVGYVFMGWMYAVTTDGGATWSVWEAGKNLPDWECCNYRLIKDVRLEADGTGVMMLNPIPQRRGEAPELHTKDYGRHWSL